MRPQVSKLKNLIFPASLSLYITVLVLGSLHPLASWQWPEVTNWFSSFEKETRYTPYNDLIINFLIYIPLGLVSCIVLRKRLDNWQLFFAACFSLAILSFTIEFLQLFIPSRAQSFVDFGMNTAGAGFGVLLYFIFSRENPIGLAIHDWRYNLFARGRYIDLGLLAIAAWGMAELNPFLPVLSFEHIQTELESINTVIQDTHGYLNLIGFALETYTIAIIVVMSLRHGHNSMLVTATFCIIVIFLKIPAYGVSTSFEQIYGLVTGLFLYFILHTNNKPVNVIFAIYAVLISFVISQLNHPLLLETHKPKPLNWIPFYFQFNRITHVREILQSLWAMSAICFLVLSYQVQNFKRIAILGLIGIGIGSFAIEWQQQKLQLTSPDITNVIISMGIWVLPFLHPAVRKALRSKPLP